MSFDFGPIRGETLSTTNDVIVPCSGASNVLIATRSLSGSIGYKTYLSVDGENYTTCRCFNYKTGAENAADGEITATDGDLYTIPCTAAVYVKLSRSSGSGNTKVDANATAGGETVEDQSVSVAGTVTVDSELPAAAALADNTANPTAPAVGAFNHWFDGTTWDRSPGNSADGAFVAGSIAHDGVDSGGPVKIGGKAVAMGTTPTAVAADDRTNAHFTRSGQQWVIAGHPNLITTEFTIADADGAQTNAALITVSSGTRIVVTQLLVTCDGDNTVNVACRVGFAAATLAAAATSGATGIVGSHPDIPAGQGFSRGSGAGILGFGADGEDLRLTCDDPVTGSIVIVVTYYTEAV